MNGLTHGSCHSNQSFLSINQSIQFAMEDVVYNYMVLLHAYAIVDLVFVSAPKYREI